MITPDFLSREPTEDELVFMTHVSNMIEATVKSGVKHNDVRNGLLILALGFMPTDDPEKTVAIMLEATKAAAYMSGVSFDYSTTTTKRALH